MELELPQDADLDTISIALQECSVGDSVSCLDERTFNRAKLLIVKQKVTGVSILLIDESGYIQKQVTGKKRADIDSAEFSDRQLSVIKALEKVLKHCQQEGVSLVGYSDELVAYPAKCKNLSEASVFALDIETFGCYSGADSSAELDI